MGTALVACARLGAACRCFSLLGDDPTGDQIVTELQREGVDASGVVRVPGGSSPFSFIHVDEDSGERTIYHRPAVGVTWSDAGDLSSIAKDNALLVDAYYMDLALSAARLARASGIPVVADTSPDRENEALLKTVDVLIAPRHFARELGCDDRLEAALDAIHDYGPSTAIITLGPDGWIASDPSGLWRGEAFPVSVVDTTGAGDVFHGAFAFGLAMQWDTPRSAEFASAVAAIKCTEPGGRTGIPTFETAMDFLRQRRGDNWAPPKAG